MLSKNFIVPFLFAAALSNCNTGSPALVDLRLICALPVPLLSISNKYEGVAVPIPKLPESSINALTDVPSTLNPIPELLFASSGSASMYILELSQAIL